MFNANKNKEVPDLEYFTLFDSKVGIYREPMLAMNRHDILRQIYNMYRDPQQAMAQIVTNPEDFALFKVGEYSKRTGVITPVNHEHIANLHDIKASVLRDQSPQSGTQKEPLKAL